MPTHDEYERAARFLGYAGDALEHFRGYPERGTSLAIALETAGAPPHGTPVRRLMTDYLLGADQLYPGADLLTIVREAETWARRHARDLAAAEV